jgi:enoyl-CoA hydratase
MIVDATEMPVLIEHDGPVTVLTLHRPAALNALNGALLIRLEQALDDVRRSTGTRAVVVTGSGERAFSAGADLGELAGLETSAAYDMLSRGQRVLRALERSTVPVIAAVNGVALGGGFELVLACTFPVLSTRARLGLPETGLGLMPGYGGTQRLTRAVGTARAAHLMLAGHRLDAASAHAIGLTPVAPVDGDVCAAAVEIAHTIAGRGPRAVGATLTALRAGADVGLDAGLALETALAAQLTAGPEAAVGIAAFHERRTPVFADRTPIEGEL